MSDVPPQEPVDPTPAPDPDGGVAEGARDPLLGRAEQIADLPLGERVAAFDGLNRAVVAELQSLEEA